MDRSSSTAGTSSVLDESSSGTTTCAARPSSLTTGGGSGLITPGIRGEADEVGGHLRTVGLGEPGVRARRRRPRGWTPVDEPGGQLLRPGGLGVGGQERRVVVRRHLAELVRTAAPPAPPMASQPNTTVTATTTATRPRMRPTPSKSMQRIDATATVEHDARTVERPPAPPPIMNPTPSSARNRTRGDQLARIPMIDGAGKARRRRGPQPSPVVRAPPPETGPESRERSDQAERPVYRAAFQAPE